MRWMRRLVPLCLISALSLVSLIVLLTRNVDFFGTGTGTRNRSWSMDYRIIFEPTVFREDRPVLFVVTSAPGNFGKRNAIRRTWGGSPSARVLYLLGVSANQTEEEERRIELEAKTHNDILQFDFEDNYRNLTLKSCALVMWVFRNAWPKRKVVIKVDDDTCVDMPLLSHILGDFKDGIYGEYRGMSKPLRCVSPACTKWGLTNEEYEAAYFPPHLQGSFYVIAESAVAKLHEYLFTPRFLFIEDVYLTGLVARAANVSVQPMPRETIVNPLHARLDWKKQKNLVAQHQCDEKFQQEFWQHTSGI
ncbi:beta-1,3-galactosyltransferase bre-2-like [Galendromus occidentalis]|uniref:Hexosyltransferase n=1 Tax=Galendromus occidentalis TaxID=34638 RepID=A0AAJ6QXL7_9ACAR|nr:beta-1,3-galactosyltransferase bre-2-like [Galendromus occidentalis]